MASLAESSVASLPISTLAQLQEHLLLHHLPKPDALQMPEVATTRQPARNDNDDKHESTHASDNSTRGSDETAEIAESANVGHASGTSQQSHPPRLSSSKSAPAADMEAMVQASPLQKAFAEMTRASSFHGFAGGDTQPMESQVYRDYNESMARSTTTTPKKTVLNMQISPDGKLNTYDTTATDKTPKTCVEGETGYIDLAQAWQPPSPTARSTSDIDDLLASPQTQLHAPDPFARPVMPETPVMAGHKRNSDGELRTSTTATTKKTPSFSQLFGMAQNGPILTATQLFNQTQQPSSPMPDAPRSDPVVTRPSPNLHEQYPLSSPAAVTSSPVMVMHDRRAARLREEFGLPAVEEDYEDDDFSQQRRLKQMRMQRVMSDQDLTRFRAPSRPGSRPTSSRKTPTTIDLVTPAVMRKGDKVRFDSFSDDEQNESVAIDEEEDVAHDEQNEDDVYDELAQTVLRSQSNPHEDLDEPGSAKSDTDKDDLNIADDPMNEANDHEQGEHERPKEVEGDADYGEQRMAGTQHSAIADSQPDRHAQTKQHVNLATHHSSMSSFVPGSQYAGKTSQDQARLARTAVKNSSACQPNRSSNQDDVPSSPPLPAIDTMPTDTAEASLARREVLAQFHPRRGAAPEQSDAVQEIPESDLPVSDGVRLPSVRRSESALQKQGDSNSVPLFSTAETHQSASGPSPVKNGTGPDHSPLKLFTSQQSGFPTESPRKAAGVRHFADIAADPPPPKASAETELDLDAIMSDVVTADDQQFIEAMSSPASERVSKRRRLMHKVSRTTARSTSPGKRGDEPDVNPAVDVAQPAAPLTMQEANVNTTDAPPAPPSPLQSSPSKANELPVSPPEEIDAPRGTQDSVKEREAAGAQAVSQLLSARSTRSGKLQRVGKKTALSTPVNFGTNGTNKASKAKLKTRAEAARGRQRKAYVAEDVVDGTINDADDPVTHQLQETNPGAQPKPTDEQSMGAEVTGAPTAQVCAPHRILALFKGRYNAFYPATWLATNSDGSSHRVRFDDTTDTIVDAHSIRSLDLHVGDQVKVDGEGMRNKTWVVQGFGPVAQTEEDKALGMDVFGRDVARVQAKASRNSLSATSAAAQGEGEVVDVLITNVYITHTMWPQFGSRQFTPPDSLAKKIVGRAETPSTGLRTPNVETPGSRSRRALVPSAKARTSHLREDSIPSLDNRRTGTGIFSGMAFAISYGSNEAEKAAVTRQIQDGGGLIFENGLDELFELPSIQDDATNAASPKKRSPRKSIATAETMNVTHTVGLRLKTEYQDLGFVALIADHHSRRAKYMQALALGLPTLSGRWITDSLDPSRNLGITPLPWSKYLLPAGESAYLTGAIRSRTMPIYNAAEARLVDTIAQRELLLNGDGVLIVAGVPKKGGNSTWQRRKAYAFLTLALGAGRIRRVSDLNEAKTALTAIEEDGNGSQWKWIYVDGSVADAGSVLFKQSGAAGNKKRKRGVSDCHTGRGSTKAMSAGDGVVKVVNDEFVVQSLILGALVD